MPSLGVLHTAVGNVPVFQSLCRELLPTVDTFQMVDESLLGNTIAAGGLTPVTTRRVIGHVVSAAEAGADAVLVTCSSIGAAVELARQVVPVPVLRVDEAMADEAIQMGQRIGVIATLPTTLAPTTDLVRRRAALASVDITLTSHLCDGAYAALVRGDTAAHDAAITAGLLTLAESVDVIILAQASMARVAAALPELPRPVPILSSPRSGVASARTALGLD